MKDYKQKNPIIWKNPTSINLERKGRIEGGREGGRRKEGKEEGRKFHQINHDEDLKTTYKEKTFYSKK